MDILIYKADTRTLIQRQALPQLLRQLPVSLHARALRYRSVQSRYQFVVGRLLLQGSLGHFGLDTDIAQIEFLENGKPTLPDIHFNIAHSGHVVVCGCAEKGELGLDIEQHQPIDFTPFTSFFSPEEWSTIKSAADPIRCFYTFWTRKESIIKANGFTLKQLHQIELDIAHDHFLIGGKKWFLQDLLIEPGFAGTVCTEHKVHKLEIVHFKVL
jgi:4'-phosphopantetheinyl transferase